MTTTSHILPKDLHLMGIALPGKTTNADGQSAIDIGGLWQRFEAEQIPTKIPGERKNEVYAVYHDYEGDHLQPFAYFIGCVVEAGTEVPEGMVGMKIPQGSYHRSLAKGKMPDCIGQAWQEIWQSDIPRSFQVDYEVYGPKSYDWNHAEVEIFLSVFSTLSGK